VSVFQILERFNRFDISEKTDLIEFRIEKVIVYKIGDIELDFTIIFLWLFSILQFFNLFFEKREIEGKSSVVGFPRLFDTENISSSSNLKIAKRYLEPSSEFGIIDDGQKSFLPVRIQVLAMIQEITGRFPIFSSHTSAKLVKLSESKTFRIIDKNRIGVEKIDPVFYDSRRQKNVVLGVLEVDNDILELHPIKLPVGNGNSDMLAKNSDKLLSY